MADLTSQPVALYLPPAGSAPVIVVCTREQHSKPVTFTRNPVEQGAPITDHARTEPLQVSLDLVISRTPVVSDGYASANDVWEQLSNLQATPALIDAVTIGGVYTSMGVDNVTRAIDSKTANAVVCTLTMSQIRVVQNKFTRIVITKQPKGQPNRKKGGVSTTDLSPADNRTAAAKLLDASGLVK